MTKILIVGHGRSGKDESVQIVSRLTGLRAAGTFSLYLAPYVAERLGVPVEQAYAERHQNRRVWMETGEDLRRHDPTFLCRQAFAHGDVSGGVRGAAEIREIRRLELADLVVWLDRDVPPDPTMEFGSDWADARMDNNGTLLDLERRWERLLKFGGILL